eukprot:3236438-Pyramimonas_sp.AAC.1
MALFFAGMSSVVGSALLTEPPNKPPKNLLVNAGGSQASRWNSAHTNPPRTIRLITLPSLAGTKRAGTSLSREWPDGVVVEVGSSPTGMICFSAFFGLVNAIMVASPCMIKD